MTATMFDRMLRGALILLVVMLIAPELSAQGSTSFPRDVISRRFFLGGSLGLSTVAPDGYLMADCRSDGEFQMSVQTGMRITAALRIEGTLTGHTMSGGNCGIIPEFGRTETEASGDVVESLYASTTTKAVLEPGQEGAPFRPRVFAGLGWIWSGSVPVLTAGLGISAGSERARFVMDVAGQWLRAHYHLVHRTYDWTDTFYTSMYLVSEIPERRVVRDRALVVRVGLQHFLGRQK